jgi:predicted dehydrogenase
VALGRKNRLYFSVDGASAAYVFDQESPERLWVGGRSENRIIPRDVSTMTDVSAFYPMLPAGHPQGYQEAFNAFVADAYAAAAGAPISGLPRFADGLRAAELTAAVVESASTESWVEVPA